MIVDHGPPGILPFLLQASTRNDNHVERTCCRNIVYSEDNIHVNMDCITQHLRSVGSAMKELCPKASKYCMLLSQAKKSRNSIETKNSDKKFSTCRYCGGVFLPNNCRVRLHARPVLTKKMKKLISRQKRQPWVLRRSEREVIAAFKKHHNKIVYQCSKCGTYTEFDGTRAPSIPTTVNSTPTILYCAKRRRKKKEMNAGLRYSLDSSQTSFKSERSLNSSYAETPVSNNCKSPMPINTPNSAEHLVKARYERESPLHENNKSPLLQQQSTKRKDSLLHQMLRENEEKKRLSSSNLMSFLSSL